MLDKKMTIAIPLVVLVVFILLFSVAKPKFLSKKDKDGKDQISYIKVIMFSASIAAIVGCAIFFYNRETGGI